MINRKELQTKAITRQPRGQKLGLSIVRLKMTGF